MTSINKLAATYVLLNEPAQAEVLYKRSLAILERTQGVEHPDTASLLSQLAGVDKSQGRFAESESLYHRALAIMAKLREPQDPDYSGTLLNLAVYNRDHGHIVQ